ncbi:hypothetical protein GIX45_21455 [Erwinia sp. CPCC 100877]|nr:hypothetical protein [Erwinia sp. CPCC 100877]
MMGQRAVWPLGGGYNSTILFSMPGAICVATSQSRGEHTPASAVFILVMLKAGFRSESFSLMATFCVCGTGLMNP